MMNFQRVSRVIVSLCLHALSGFTACSIAIADTIYQDPSDFIDEVFLGAPPAVSILNIIGKRRETVSKILDHPPSILRTRYWMKDTRSVWILEEIGKSKPITAGFIVENGQIQDVRILIYRESHGGEVRHDFFTNQFSGATLDSDLDLTQSIDGISGATLSVNAMRRLATLALYFDKEARTQ